MPGESPGCSRGPILVAHPGVQHSRELVRALYQGELLLRFVTSFNGGLSGAAWLPAWSRNGLRVRATKGVPDHAVTTIPYIEAIVRLLSPMLSSRLAQQLSYAGLEYFDRLASEIVLSSGPRIVVGFENSCRRIFRNAKVGGAICVLDAASVHHSAQPAHDMQLDEALRIRINQNKDEEIQLADHIVVLSSFARETYVAAGVPDYRISVIPPGVWMPSHERHRRERQKPDGIRFLFVGNVTYVKGVDILLEAFTRLDAPGKHLILVGSAAANGVLPDDLPKGVECRGQLPRDAVYDAYANADVLVLPSRADGFGFVVAEAMACGLPVIVSSATGAKDLVEEGATGWIFESGNVEDLLRVMGDAHSRRVLLPDMGSLSRQAVARFTWEEYGDRVRKFYSQLLVASKRTEAKEASKQ